ncbi:urease accessory protein UreH domain-containing protein [Anaerocolumna xylanovorans]|uniref:Sulfite exporter TauE/SafE n=1 Tax=Anaerocolumna xylanovorans DSM 12503 TaxID=1121345 RepID=A0A1M7YJX9_9FIRM|nr:sulfite exporter TauE/SafE family protein [Anaerocolumna xylanovorans]SHO52907.1 Sulfite exporter TauE/SafE [Anaerocolumna xylanovorans DSM 12503]
MENTKIHGVLMVEGLKDEISAEKIEEVLRACKGVLQVKAVLQSANIYLTYEKEEVSLEELADAVESLGYRVLNKPAGSRVFNSTLTGLVLSIKGMSCVSCEAKIEKRLNELKGVEKAKVSYKNANAVISYNSQVISQGQIEKEIEKLDYGIGREKDRKTGKGAEGLNQILGIGIILLAVYLIQKNTGVFQFVPQINQNMSYGILFLVGILTSVHCIAMCGGINLSQCVPANARETAGSGISKYKPGLLYNAGRVVSYTVIGGIVGAFGSVISLSGTARGAVAVISGIFMVVMGLNMLNIFPALRKIMPRMPKIFRKKLAASGRMKGPFYIGLLNGLMPCGPLQSMQLYALGTGSFIGGALSMLLFSLGTVPLMFGFSAVAGLLSSKYTKKMMKISAALVMALGVIMLNRGLSLSGIDLVHASITAEAGNTAKVEENVQVVTTKLQSGSYEPIVVQKGVPVKWIIKAEKKDLNGCNDTIIIPKYNIQAALKEGDNIIEFTPDETGTIPYSCWMGMIRSSIEVVDNINTESGKDTVISKSQNLLEDSSTSGGCCGTTPKGFENGKIPTDNITVAEVKDGKQEVTVTVDGNGYTPAVIVLQKGVDARIKFEGKDLNSCNSTVVFPEYQGQIDLTKETETPWLPTTADYTFQCSMNMLHGYVKVVDDVKNVNLDEIKSEVGNYTPSAGSSSGGCCGGEE